MAFGEPLYCAYAARLMSSRPSFDYLVGAREQLRRHTEAEQRVRRHPTTLFYGGIL
jgi:hypothetical protein